MSGDYQIELASIGGQVTLRDRAYESLRNAIGAMDIYHRNEEVRLDERKLSHDLGISRTPVREALNILQQQGFVRSEARRGVFVIRKSKREIIDMVYSCAALESMAARLACERATDAQIGSLRGFLTQPDTEYSSESSNEYFVFNIEFHRKIVLLAQCPVIQSLTNSMFIHLQNIRDRSFAQNRWLSEAIAAYTAIMEALEVRDAEAADRMIRVHALASVNHINLCGGYLD
ncbi:GntR family transcriptional regulator [Methylobacterium sp. Leaf117]|uniref:GntR family transcriptional regulator n=1 Tax=Methylobacterium sp. Leaf117 TaxID=1736260 RepID=UPI0009E88B76|nr:GntR family transcriptional regulator [Methylobacterium sp. Leaf117]